MTNEELAEKGIEEAALALMQASGGPGVPARETARIAVEAYLRITEPEGERIEGIVVEESRDFKTNKLNRVVLEARDGDMADPTRYACATLIFHTRKEGENG